MNRPLLLISALALTAVMAAPLPASAQRRVQYQSQPSRNFDGFCYVRENSVRADAETDYWGTRRGYGRCYHGEYYVYSGHYTVAPRAPDGYVARYFTRRPNTAFYDRVYSAETLAGNVQTETRSDTRYDDRDDAYEDGRRYNDRRYDPPRSDEYPAEETRPALPRAPIYNTSRDDAEAYSDDQATVGRYEQSAPSDDYARDSRAPDANGYIAPYDARTSYTEAEGWQDDQGAWHVGRPAAIGWQDEHGQWHEGQVQRYGWRNRYGEWHEVRDGGQ